MGLDWTLNHDTCVSYACTIDSFLPTACAMNSKQSLIVYDRVGLSHSGKRIFASFSLQVKVGEKVLLGGASGSGKSSLLKMLLGFVKPTEGTLSFEGALLDEKQVWEVRKKIAYVDQGSCLGAGRVTDLIDFIFSLKANHAIRLVDERVDELLAYFHLDRGLLDKSIEHLSGGERQRMALVIAVLLERKVFLLDEVTSGLDKQLKQKVVDFFVTNPEWTCLIVSHDPIWSGHESIRKHTLEERLCKQ